MYPWKKSEEVREVTGMDTQTGKWLFPTSSKQLELLSVLPWLGWGGREGNTPIQGHPSCHLAMLYLGRGRGAR
jgi:hypothetical protein